MVGDHRMESSGLGLHPGFCLASLQQGFQAFYKDTGRKARWRQLNVGEKICTRVERTQRQEKA